MRRAKIAILVGLCFIVLSCTDKASTETDKVPLIENKATLNVMPRELVYYAEENGYEQVSTFYEGYDIINPPFVFGVGPGREYESAAFWVQKQFNEEVKYYLMFYYENPKNKSNSCPDIVEYDRGSLGGLVIDEYIDFVPDEEFKFLNDRNKQMSGTPQSSKGILSYRVGVEVLLFCYDNEWMVRFRH